MDFKDILVSVDATDAGEGRLRLAAAIAREHHAHLSAAYVLLAAAAGTAEGGLIAAVPHLVPPPAGANATGAAALAEIIEQRFHETVGPHAIAGDWHLFEEREGENLVALLKAVDLAVFGQGAPDYRLPSGFRPEDIVIASGRPVIIVPYAGTFDAVGRRVLVAWDETREASRALHDSLPLIAKAEAVTVMTVRTREASFEHDGPSLDRIVRHLERHGIPARAEETLRGDLSIADVLLSRAADLGVDLIVAGAYHHSPIREALLGGVSRELFDHMTVPVLMSH